MVVAVVGVGHEEEMRRGRVEGGTAAAAAAVAEVGSG